MTVRGFARGRSAAQFSRLALLLSAATFFPHGPALADPPFVYGGYTWNTDRADTAYHNTITFAGRNDVLNLGIRDMTTVPGSSGFYQTEGYNTLTGLPIGSGFISGDIYLPPGAATSDASHFQSVGLWGVIGLSSTQTPEMYPIVQFYNGPNPNPDQPSTPGSGTTPDFVGEIRGADNGDGNPLVSEWEVLTGPAADPAYALNPATTINYGAWNKLRVNYISGTTVGGGSYEYLINGTVVARQSGAIFTGMDPAASSLYEIILNSRTNGVNPYDVYWSNIQSSMLVPAGTTRVFAPGTYGADLEIGAGGTATGGSIGMPYIIGGDVNNLGGSMQGWFNVVGDFFNDGTISPGASPAVNNIAGNYTPGVNARFDMQLDLTQAMPVAGVDYDQINIGGNVSGVTPIFLFEPSPVAVPPTVPLADTGPVPNIGGFDLVTIGGAAGGVGNFTLGQRYVRNGLEIFLDQRTGRAGRIIGLRFGPPPESYNAAALGSEAIAGGDMILGTYVDRRGLDWEGKEAAWMHGVTGVSKFNGGNGVVKTTLSGAQFGLDLVSLGGPETRAGVTAGFASLSSDVKQPGGGSAGSATGQQPSIGGYLTHAGGPFYADLLAQYRFLNFGVNAPSSKGLVTGSSIDVAAESGLKFDVSDSLSIVPFAQLVYQHVVLNNATIGPVMANFGTNDSLIGRARVLVQAKAAGLSLFGTAGVSTDLLGSKKTNVSGVNFATSTGPRAEFTAGVEGDVGGNLAIFSSGEYDVSFDGNSQTYLGKAGLRKRF